MFINIKLFVYNKQKNNTFAKFLFNSNGNFSETWKVCKVINLLKYN
jgi:hypothetical protein